jgi:hypothetical protein
MRTTRWPSLSAPFLHTPADSTSTRRMVSLPVSDRPPETSNFVRTDCPKFHTPPSLRRSFETRSLPGRLPLAPLLRRILVSAR